MSRHPAKARRNRQRRLANGIRQRMKLRRLGAKAPTGDVEHNAAITDQNRISPMNPVVLPDFKQSPEGGLKLHLQWARLQHHPTSAAQDRVALHHAKGPPSATTDSLASRPIAVDFNRRSGQWRTHKQSLPLWALKVRYLRRVPDLTLRYLTRFACIADACEDTCCAGQQIPVSDEEAIVLARALKGTALESIVPLRLDQPVSGFNQVMPRTAGGACQCLSPKGMCSVVELAGSKAIPSACVTFPRVFRQRDDSVMVSATLACPEAARLCLLRDDAVEAVAVPEHRKDLRRPNALPDQRRPSTEQAGTLHATGLALLRERTLPLKQRLSQLYHLTAPDRPVLTDVMTPSAEASQVVIKTVLPWLLGLVQVRSSVRFQGLVLRSVASLEQTARELEPEAFLAESASPWAAFTRAYAMRREALAQALGTWLQLVLERYWVNQWQGLLPSQLDEENRTHTAFRMLLKAAALNLLLAGNVTLSMLAQQEKDAALTDTESAARDAALVETVQLFAKHVERDVALLEMLEQHVCDQAESHDIAKAAEAFASFL